jgi:hypothetical protein
MIIPTGRLAINKALRNKTKKTAYFGMLFLFSYVLPVKKQELSLKPGE